MSKSNELTELNIKRLFTNEVEYIIPIYQRNYAWEEKQIVQLIDDINDYKNNISTSKYYIGSLVVYKRDDEKLEVIDGQQRLTTLFILLSILKDKHFEIVLTNQMLTFESRKKSSDTLNDLLNGSFENKNLNSKILQAKLYIEKKLKNFEIDKFYDYLMDNVIILRVEVPKDTDLNHYFEIMNNRGEQLEKHEILKSRMLEKLKDNEKEVSLFNTIWEACSNMEKYLQYGFSPKYRSVFFGKNWNEFHEKSFDDLIDKVGKVENSLDTNALSIKTLITANNISEKNTKNNNDSPERFTSVINFSNFLLHVLKIQEQTDIPLDDKRLLDIFAENKVYKDKNSVKKFIFSLLKLKFLFDNYIIKREYTNNSDEWSLKQLMLNDTKSKTNTAYYKNRFDEENENKELLLLLSMFHVSAPTLIYKHWLSASLKYLFKEENIKSSEYIEYLQKLANAYMKDRFLSKTPFDYHEIIFTNNSQSENSNLDCNIFNQGTDVENYIFNYLDYLLWKKYKSSYSSFVFSFRTSVEHYYPQNPMENIDKLKIRRLNNFGNLCLVSRSENSRLSNFTPKAKKDFYTKQNNNSIKQQIMMAEDNWTKDEIKLHNKAMIEILKNAF